MNENTPVKKDLKYLLIKPSALAKKFRGRKRSKIVITLNRDIKRTEKAVQ